MTGFRGLFLKETLRFWRVAFQTIGAPILTTFLYLFVFSHVLGERSLVYGKINYTEFLIPGLVLMTVLQNAFANSSSSLIQSKLAGNLILILLPPISPLTFFCAYTGGAVLRGLAVGLGVLISGFAFAPALSIASPILVLIFALLAAAMSGALGIIAGLWSEKFDQMAMFNGFIIVPLTFLSGVFYSVHSLPPLGRFVSHINPFFYMVDGFRRGFFGVGDSSLALSFSMTAVFTIFVSWLALHLLTRGYKIRL